MNDARTKTEAEADAYALVAGVLGCPAEELTPESSIVTHPDWDSFAHLEIMMLLAERYGVEITEETIDRYGSMAEIAALHEAARAG